jgi:UrcA family protein
MVKETMMKPRTALFAFAALMLPLPTLADAAPAIAAPGVAVAVDDLDLASDEGQRRADARIHRAARMLCRADAVASLPRAVRAERECVRQARARAAAIVTARAADRAAGESEGG